MSNDKPTFDRRQSLDLLDDLIGRAKKCGAEAADAVYINGVSLSLARRLDRPEHLERSEAADIGLRVLIGKRQAIVSSSDYSAAALDQLCERAVAMARAVPEDPYCGLAEPAQLAGDIPDLDSCDPVEPSAERLTELAARAEQAALAVSGVSNSEGAQAAWGMSTVALAASNGFARAYSSSSHSLSVSVLAGDGVGMERDYDYATAVYGADLPPAEDIGRAAGERAVRRLNPRKVQTTAVPVVFDSRVSGSLVSHFAGAINGASVARGTSFLKQKMGRRLFSQAIDIIDDPHRKRALKSRPFDAEGIATSPRKLIENGVLQSWIMDLRTARQLGLETTGSASRGTSSPPSPSTSNLFMAAGQVSPDELIADIKEGLYISELIGFGVNGVTGDYSRGASGFWIENGEIGHSVSEITIAGNLLEMFAHITAADDLVFRYGTNAPTLRVDGMTLAGS